MIVRGMHGRGGMRALGRRRLVVGSCAQHLGTSGQMTVEFAVVFPVLLAVGFIAANGYVFLGDCAAFDMVARDAIRMQADDGGGDMAQCAADVRARIEEGISMEHERVSVLCERTEAGHMKYTAKTSFSPPFLRGVRVFGVEAPRLMHELTFTVSPYRAGVAI